MRYTVVTSNKMTRISFMMLIFEKLKINFQMYIFWSETNRDHNVTSSRLCVTLLILVKLNILFTLKTIRLKK